MYTFYIYILYILIMPVICWGPLAKSANDPTTISEYIAGRILDHNVNPSSHSLDGYAIFNHRDAAVLDHVDGSVLIQKLTSDHRIIISAFESLDGWVIGGSIFQELGSLTIRAGNTINTYAYIVNSLSGVIALNWSKDFFWQSTIRTVAITDQIIYFGLGGSDYLGGYSGAGFKIVNGTLYAYHCNMPGVTLDYTTFEITGITLTDLHVYRIIYDQSAGTLSFYIDGVLKKIFDSSLPTENSDEIAMYEVKTTAAAYKYIYAFDLLISIPR